MCKHEFKKLRFHTEDISICTRCVNTLNDSPAPAVKYKKEFAEMLARGMLRNAQQDLNSTEDWKREKSRRTLEDLDLAVENALHDWITKLLSKPDNNGERKFKSMRAYRRGILRMEGFAERPNNWKDVARQIRQRDRYQCMDCGAADTLLDVHHIVYLSHHGTNQKHNLVTLCRKCHEAVHGRVFDILEVQEQEEIFQKKEEGQKITQNISEAQTIPKIESLNSTIRTKNTDIFYSESQKIQKTLEQEKIIWYKKEGRPASNNSSILQKTPNFESDVSKIYTKNTNNCYSEELKVQDFSEQDKMVHAVAEKKSINQNISDLQAIESNCTYILSNRAENNNSIDYELKKQNSSAIVKDSRVDNLEQKSSIPAVFWLLIVSALIIAMIFLFFIFVIIKL